MSASCTKKQRFQVGLDLLFLNASVCNSSLLSVLVSSTGMYFILFINHIGALVQKYSGPDAVSVPMELLIRYGDCQDKFELLFQLFDMAPTTQWRETVKLVHEQLVKNPLANKLAKCVPALWVTTGVSEDKKDIAVMLKQQQSVLKRMREQVVNDIAPSKQFFLNDQAETAVSLVHAVKDFEYWVKTLLIQKKELESPVDWEVTIRTSRESFSAESEICVVFTPGVFSSISFFSPLGYYRTNPNAPLPTTVLNVDISYPALASIEKGDPRHRFASHLQGMWVKLAGLAKSDPVATASIPLNLLPWLPENEETLLLDVNSGLSSITEYSKSCPLDPSERLVDIFASTVAHYGRRRAIFSPAEGISMNYEEFDRKSTQLAHALRAAGVTGGNVSMMLPRSAMMYIAIIGILKSGAAYVPIDPEYPSDRVAFIVSDSDSHMLLTNSKLPIFFPTVVAHHAKNSQTSSKTPNDLAELSDALRLTLTPFTGSVWLLDIMMDSSIAEQSIELFPCPSTSESLAYIIYTSGSTGRPKGVQLENRSVCALVRAERLLYNSTPNDITWQGFSIAFDASVEELWLAWAGGGTLFCATHEMIHAGPALADIWAEHRVTIVSTVPTLLTMLEDENLGSLRILILGGEACHRDLIVKWSKGRRMINTYGPTEATVIATSADVKVSNSIVTIGKPIAHYTSYIVDPATLQLAPKGVPGELLLGGPGLARGYVKRPDLTDKVFIPNPFRRTNSNDPDRLYRTGDLTRWSEHGEIEFMGRIDAQVKLRGFRVELAEIESVLLQSELVLSVVCHVMTVSGAQQLVAFIVPNLEEAVSGVKGSLQDFSNPDTLPDLFTPQQEQDLKEKLRVRLPPYMVPSIFETLWIIPVLPSGKANRKQLPYPRSRASKIAITTDKPKPNSVEDFGFDDVQKEEKHPTNSMEKIILPLVCELFAQSSLPVTANFFELGGHSVLVARLVSMLRKDPMTSSATMADIYNNPTVASLAAHLNVKNGSIKKIDTKRSSENHAVDVPKICGKDSYIPVNRVSYYLCWFAQAILLYFVWAVPAFMLLFAYKFFMWRLSQGDPWWGSLLLTFPVLSLFYPAMLFIAIVLKWILLGRVQPGKYRIWGWWFLKWWIVKKVTEFVPMTALHGTIFLNWYYVCLGTSVGRGCYIGTTDLHGHDLIEIGDDTSIGADAHIEGYRVFQGSIILGKIVIGKRCYIGNRSMIIGSCLRTTTMEDDSQLGDLSLLPAGAVIPTKQNWAGSPSRYAADVIDLSDEMLANCRPSWLRELGMILGKLIIFEIVPWFLIAEIAPLFCVIYFNRQIFAWFGSRRWAFYLALPLPTATLSLLTLALSLLMTKWILIQRWKSTVVYLHSFDYLRKWAYELIMSSVSFFLHPMYSSLYFPPFLWALGAKLGSDTEVSTAVHFTPDLLEIGEGCFIADDVCLGAPVVHLNWMQLGKVVIGDKSFLGNSALLPINTVAGSHVLVGAVSTGPRKAHSISLPDDAWLEEEDSDAAAADPKFKQQHLTYAYERLPLDASTSGGSASEPADDFGVLRRRPKKTGAFDSFNVPDCEIPDQTNWFGVPAIRLPRRIDWTNKFSDVHTFAPPWYMRALRYIIEYFRIVLPITYVTTEFLLFVFNIEALLDVLPGSKYPNPKSNLNLNLVFWPLIFIASGVISALFAFVAKWILVGQYVQSDWPLWSSYVWRSELVVALCESLADPLIINSLRGTPFISAWLRFMGTRVGSYAYIDSLQITEFDLVTIGNEATIGQDATLQSHLFEDRICKMESVMIGDYCSIGSLSVVLYASRMEDGSSLSARSLLMKNESLPAWTQWHGLPASPYHDADI